MQEQDVSFNTLYELAESLVDILNELARNGITLRHLGETVRSDFQEHWANTARILSEVISQEQICSEMNLLYRRLGEFSKRKIAVVGLEERKGWVKTLWENAEIKIPYPAPQSSGNRQFLEAESIFDEGEVIAAAAKRTLDEEKNVLIVSPDKKLSDIVKFELLRWNIHPEISSGESFSYSPEGIVVAQILRIIEEQCSVTSTLNFLKMNPQFREQALELEYFFRKKNAIPRNFASAVALYPDRIYCAERLIEILSEIQFSSHESFSRWFDICEKLMNFIYPLEVPGSLRNVAPSFLWSSPIRIAYDEFCVFCKKHILLQPIASKTIVTPGIAILEVADAQLLDADLVIVAGVNEDFWGKQVKNFWVTQAMKKRFNLWSEDEEFRRTIFSRLISKGNVLITRSQLIDGIQQQQYRYFAKISPTFTVLDSSNLIQRPKGRRPENFRAPSPEISLRPKVFWVSDLDLLYRNPYAFYAKKILNLPEINHINELKNIQGNYLHKVLEEFTKQSKRNLPELQLVAKKVLANLGLTPLDFGLWFFRLPKIFSFVISQMCHERHYPEIQGRCSLLLPCEIRCKVDRIDVNASHTLSLIDYKTGQTPSIVQVQRGEKVQLPLEAIVARNGGFGLKETAVEHLFYWKLTGKGEGGKIICVAKDSDEVTELCAKTLETLKKVIERYNTSGDAYEVNVESPYERSYQHLARVKEWSHGK
jgi:ATP-dependent helicase/nuclease subunit B